MDLKKTKTDPKAEREGVWIQNEDARFKIARMRNPAALAAFQEKTRFLRGRIPDAKQEEIMTEVMAEHILIGWENVTIGGDVLDYSREAAAMVLKEFPEIRAFVFDESQKVENFLAETTAEGIEAVKKS
jgi:hypothetical protein